MTDRLRVSLLVTRSDVFGGAVIHVRDLAVGLLGDGHDVEVMIGGQGPMLERLRTAGIPTTSVPHLERSIRPSEDARVLRYLVARWRDGARPDLVHAHTAKAGLLGRVAAARLAIPCVYTPHAWAFLDGVPAAPRQAYLRIEQLAGRLPSSVINVCQYEQEFALVRGVGPLRRHFTIHNGVPDVDPECRAEPRRQPARLLVVARFEPQKDHALLVRALAGLAGTDWELELVGDGPMRRACEAQVAAAGLADRIHFVGEVDDVDRRMARAQVLVLPSRWEALPLTVLEAMRAGLPVVATDVGGLCEAVVDGMTGLLVPRGDVVALRRALARVLGSPDLRGRMGAAARDRYVTNFTVAGMVAETVRVYRTTLLRHVLGQTSPVLTPATATIVDRRLAATGPRGGTS